MPSEDSRRPPLGEDADNDFGRFLAWYDDRLIAGDDVTAGPISHLTETLERASIADLQRFEAAMKLLHAWRKNCETDDFPDRESTLEPVSPDSSTAIRDESNSEGLPVGQSLGGLPEDWRPPLGDISSNGDTASPSQFSSQPVQGAPFNPTPPRDSVPTPRARFELERLLGYGASGMVLKAWDSLLERNVAIKSPQPLRGPGGWAQSEFLRESQAIARLDHKGIVPIYDLKLDDEAPWIVMAYCEGGSLAHWLQAHPGPLPVREAARVVAELADALHVAHENGVVHRDLKPGNILLTAEHGGASERRVGQTRSPGGAAELSHWQLKIADFGLAARTHSSEPGLPGQPRAIGTPAYMSPEQIKGRPDEIDKRSDVYGLGVILFELLTGSCPYPGTTSAELRSALATTPVPSSRTRNPKVPIDLDRIVQCCLAKRPADRYASAAEMARNLRAFLANRPVIGMDPPGLVDRVVKWITRKWVAVALGVSIAASLLSAIYVNQETSLEAEWRKAFGALPREIHYPGIEQAKIGGLMLDWQSGGYALTGDSARLVQLGAITNGDFEFAIQFDQASWSTDFGLFLGYHQHPWRTDRLGAAQLIWVQVKHDVGVDKPFELRRTLEVVSNASANLFAPHWGPLAGTQLTDFTAMDPTLKVVVRKGRLAEVWWSGRLVPELCGELFDAAAEENGFTCEGPFGVFIRGGGQVWLKHPHFHLLPPLGQ